LKRGAVAFTFTVLSAFFLGASLVWLLLDRSAPTWDDSIYLTKSLAMVDALADQGLFGYARTFLTIMDFKPPLIAALPTPVYLIVGRHPRAACAVNLFFMLVLFAAVFRIARKFSNARAGLLAVYIVATMPMIYGLSRWYLVECSLTAIVAITIYMLCESDQMATSWKVLALGVLCAAGLLLKFSFPLYVLVPFLYYAIMSGWKVVRWKTVLLLTIPVIVLAAPWYLLHFRRALEVALFTGSADSAVLYSQTREVYSFAILRDFLARIFNAGPAIYFAALPVLLVIVWRNLSPLARAGLRLCGLWVSPILFLLMWRAREVRYVAPLYPAFAVALAILIDSVIQRGGKWRYSLVGILLALPLVSMLHVSFGFFGRRSFELGGLLFVEKKLVYARTYDRRPWPYQEFLDDLYRATKGQGYQDQLLVVGTDAPRFNADTIALAAAKRKLPFRVTTTAYEKDWSTVLPMLDSSSFFLYEEGGEPRSYLFNAHEKAALKEVRESGNFLESPLSRWLPDGGVVRVFENLSRNGFVRSGAFLPASFRKIPDCEVTFGGLLRLSGFAMEQKDGAVEVKYRWQCLRPSGHDYWCFTHILDAEGNVVGNLDHPILNGDPPLTTWKEGDVAIETLRFRSPIIRAGQTYRLRLGFYDRTSGQRIPIGTSVFPLTDGQTAVVASGRR
jgi:hypothetical protein